MTDGALSLEQIEHDVWGDPQAGATRLVCTAYELHRKPVASLTPEDLRLLIGQQVGIDVLVPYALALLGSDPLVAGDFHPGDLLVTVMRLPPEYWAAHPGQTTALRKIAKDAKDTESCIQGDIDRFLSVTAYHTPGLPVAIRAGRQRWRTPQVGKQEPDVRAPGRKVPATGGCRPVTSPVGYPGRIPGSVSRANRLRGSSMSGMMGVWDSWSGTTTRITTGCYCGSCRACAIGCWMLAVGRGHSPPNSPAGPATLTRWTGHRR
jgi:hypothetical protein